MAVLRTFALFAALALLAGCMTTAGGVSPGSAAAAAPQAQGPQFALISINGPPAEFADRLTNAVDMLGFSSDLGFAGVDIFNADFTVTGYLSVIGGNASSIIVYVWDVARNGGARVDRISGQMSVAGSGDPFTGGDALLLNRLAGTLIDGIEAWLRDNPNVA
jgi:hypothetical protein